MSTLTRFFGWLGRANSEDIAKIVINLGVGIPIISFFLKSVGALPTNSVFPVVTQDQGITAIFLIVYGGALGLSVGALTFGRKKADGRVENVSQRWGACVTRLEETLLKARFGDLWLSHPWDYVEFLKSVDESISAANPHSHLNEITLYGTMVGFSFLLPEPLYEQIIRAEGHFSKLSLLGSNARTRLSSTSGDEELSRFPLYLVAQLVSSLFGAKSPFVDWLKAGRTFSIQICYLDHDMLSAAILCGGVEAATLQALDSSLFQRIVKGEQAQPGFRYHNTTHVDAFDRIKAVLTNVAHQFAGTRQGELWKFSVTGTEPQLTITAPHWKVDHAQTCTSAGLIEGCKYHTSPGADLVFTGTSAITHAMGVLIAHIENLSPINSLKPFVEEYRAGDWKKSRAYTAETKTPGAI